MKKFAIASATSVLLAGAALAAGTGSFQVQTTLTPSCTITGPTGTVTIQPDASEQPLGDLAYSCNFQVGSAVVDFAGTSNLGPRFAIATADNGGSAVPFSLQWDVANSNFGNVFYGGNVLVGTIINPALNTSTGAPLVLKLDNAPTVAGTYNGTIAFSITP